MKVLINDYSSTNSTQCTYFADQLHRIDGVTTALWGGQGSLYDVMDQFNPDVYIVHCNKFGNDLYSYMEDKETTPIKKLILVANNLPHQAILDSEVFMQKLGYKDHTYITNNIKHLNKAPENTVYLPEAADASLVQMNHVDYSIFTGIVVDTKEDIGELPDGSCHILSTNPELKGHVDICRSLVEITPLLKNYKNISIRSNEVNLPQIYFDAVLSGANVTLDSSNPHCKTRLEEICKRVFGCDCNSGDRDTILNTIMEKHLSAHRAKTLLSLLPTPAPTSGKYFDS